MARFQLCAEGFMTPENALKVHCVSQEYRCLEQWLPQRYGVPVQPERQKLSHLNGRVYDIFLCQHPTTGEEERFYFDITSFYGRASGRFYPLHFDLPEPLCPIDIQLYFPDLWHLFAESTKDRASILSEIKIIFMPYSSEMLSQSIAFIKPGTLTIEATTVRRFIDEYLPLSHGYLFARLFILHQFQHLYDNHDSQATEIVRRADYYQPKPGIDCIEFTPIVDLSVAQDFVNYMFWSHKPDAFADVGEIAAFLSCASLAKFDDLFTLDELRHALDLARTDIRTLEQLTFALDRFGQKS